MEEWSINFATTAYFLAAGISFFMTVWAWLLRPAKGALQFSIMMFFTGIWVSSYIVGLINSGFTWKIIFIKLEYLGLAVAVYMWFIFVATYTQFSKGLNKYTLTVLAIIPLYVIFNIFRAPEATGFFSDFVVVQIEDVYILQKESNTGFHIWVAYAYLMFGGGLLLLILRMANMPAQQRKQIFLLAPTLLLLVPNAIYLINNNTFYPYNPTPATIALAGILFLLSIRYYKFIEVIPVVHAQIFKNMRNAVIVTDTTNKIMELNPAAQHIFKKKQKDVVGKNVLTILPDSSVSLKDIQATDEIKGEVVFKNIGRIFELKINRLVDSSGGDIGRILLFSDITEQKKAIYELDAYARTVAHDLKTPIHNSLGIIQLLQKYYCSENENTKAHHHLKNLFNSTLKMNEIVEGLLLLAKVNSLDVIERQPLEMMKILRTSINRIKSLLNENVELVVHEKIINSYGYSIWVEEVWVNLISNAIKFGGENPKIEISSYLKENMAYYSVKDNGIGIPVEVQANLFTEFSRLHEHKSEITGHGLGLSIVKRIIEKLGGKVGANSLSGDGSTFYFSLPFKP